MHEEFITECHNSNKNQFGKQACLSTAIYWTILKAWLLLHNPPLLAYCHLCLKSDWSMADCQIELLRHILHF